MLLLVLLLLITGCRGGDDRSAQGKGGTVLAMDTTVMADTMSTEMRLKLEAGIVKNRVEGIYRIVKESYMANGGIVQNEILDKCYCSKEWNKLLMAVRYKEHLTNTLFFEVDYWSMARESAGLVSFDEFEVTDLTISTEKMTASVNFTVFELDTYTPARVDLVYENGQWMIDNFHNLKYMVDARKSMRFYLINDFLQI